MKIEEALDRYLVQLEADGRSEHTKGQAARHVRLLASWLESEDRIAVIARIGHEDLAAFLANDVVRLRADGKPRKPTSANALRSSLRAFFGFVHAAGYSTTNPARLIRRARCGAPVPKALSESDQARLLAALAGAQTPAEQRDRVLFTLLLRTGARVGSVLASRVEDLDLDAGELHLRREKGRRERVLLLPGPVVELLRDHIGERSSGPVFAGAGGGSLTPRHAARRLGIWCERAGIRVSSPHCLRHSFATGLYRRTGDLLLTREALGHASLASTAVYSAVSSDRLRRAVAG